MAVNDFTSYKEDCLSCPCQEALPRWCDGSCSSCKRIQECPCCNPKVREQLRQGGNAASCCREACGDLEEVNIKIVQIAYPAPWQQRPVDNQLIRKMAAELRERGQISPIEVRPRARRNDRSLYQVVNGEVRIRGAIDLGWSTVRAIVKEMDDCEASIDYLLDNIAERRMPWEEVAKGILSVEAALARKTGGRCDSRQLGKALGRSKDWINDHKHALRLAQAHGVPKGAIPHYKLLRPLRRGLAFHIEEEIIRGIVGQRWTVHRVLTEVNERWDPYQTSDQGRAL